MLMLNRSVVAGVLLMISTVLLPEARAAERPTIVIRVVDYAQVDSWVLSEAQHHVARVFGVVGITTVWRDGTAVAPANVPVQVTVLLLSAAMTAAKTATENLGSSTLGSTAPSINRAWIFYQRIEDASRDKEASTGLMLGHVIAHEVAHTIANLGHSDAGVMTAGVQNLGRLQGFGRDEARQLRAAIDSRTRMFQASRR